MLELGVIVFFTPEANWDPLLVQGNLCDAELGEFAPYHDRDLKGDDNVHHRCLSVSVSVSPWLPKWERQTKSYELSDKSRRDM